MNIAKQKEIIRLRKDVETLQDDYFTKKVAYEEQYKPEYFDSAIKSLKNYLKKEGFQETEDKYGRLQMEQEGIIIRIDISKNRFTVNMPNGEKYNIGIKMMEPQFDTYVETPMLNQDSEIDRLNKFIDQFKTLFETVGTQKFCYTLFEEKYKSGNIDYTTRYFNNFNEIIKIMFS